MAGELIPKSIITEQSVGCLPEFNVVNPYFKLATTYRPGIAKPFTQPELPGFPDTYTYPNFDPSRGESRRQQIALQHNLKHSRIGKVITSIQLPK